MAKWIQQHLVMTAYFYEHCNGCIRGRHVAEAPPLGRHDLRQGEDAICWLVAEEVDLYLDSEAKCPPTFGRPHWACITIIIFSHM